jgi:hypothetical protein
MAFFKFGAPIESKEPNIAVEIDPTDPLPVGRRRFQLIVVDDSGNESLPAELVVIIADNERPTAVIDGPSRVSFKEPFRLTGEKSFDIGGKVVLWRWTLLD